MKLKTLITILLTFSIIFSQDAFAARLGGGKRSYGMQRSTTNYYKPQQSYNSTAAPQQGTTTGQQRSGMGAGTAAALGAAAGAAGGYMLGRSMNDNNNVNPNNINASGPQQAMQPQETHSNIPWGMIAILAILLFIGLMFFRRGKTSPWFSGDADAMNHPANNPNNLNINKTNSMPQMNNSNQNWYSANSPQAPINDNMEKMADGVEKVYFLRQAKGMFLHIQSMNNRDNVGEIEKYLTPSLYQELKDEVANNSFIADFSNLDCQLLSCEVNNNQLIASVKFFGMVSEEPEQPAKPFSEIWNFVKTDLAYGKWLVAGIQQETLN